VHIGVEDVELHLCGAKKIMNYLFENINLDTDSRLISLPDSEASWNLCIDLTGSAYVKLWMDKKFMRTVMI
jgi:hypothetical protein